MQMYLAYTHDASTVTHVRVTVVVKPYFDAQAEREFRCYRELGSSSESELRTNSMKVG